jgi:hypothetical protein
LMALPISNDVNNSALKAWSAGSNTLTSMMPVGAMYAQKAVQVLYGGDDQCGAGGGKDTLGLPFLLLYCAARL